MSDVIDAFTEIWPQNWGPRMEDYLRGPLLTMAAANEMLLRDFAFEEWLVGASAAFAANDLRVRRGRLYPLAIEMVNDTWQSDQGPTRSLSVSRPAPVQGYGPECRRVTGTVSDPSQGTQQLPPETFCRNSSGQWVPA